MTTRREIVTKCGAGLAAIIAAGRAPAAFIRSMLAARNGMMAGKRLPYDAEVEYLESPGTQWIDTGVVGNERIAIDVRWSYASTSASTVQWGARTSVNQNSVLVAGSRGTATDTQLYPSFGTNIPDQYAAQSAVGNNVWECHLENGRQDLYKDGALVLRANNNTSSFSTVNTIPLLALWNSSTQFLNRTGGRIWLCKIWEDGAQIRDMIAVRLTNELGQTEGAMYDRLGVGGMNPDGSARTDGLYRNRGTDAFVLGPDI